MSQTILVTGGAGYIGSMTVKSLLEADYDVVVLDSLENGHRDAVDSRAKLEVADLADKNEISRIFKENKIEAVIDFAAYLAVGESMEKPDRYMDNNVLNFINLLDVMVENGCKYVIKSSTASTYGNPEEKYFPLREDYQDQIEINKSALLHGKWGEEELSGEEFFKKIIDYYQTKTADRPELQLDQKEIAKLRIPASVYGLTKLLDEIVLKKYDLLRGIKSVALRYFNVCGATIDGQMGEDKPSPTTLMTVCFWQILGRFPKIEIFGTDYPTKDGTGIRDYIHPLDLASGHIAALKYIVDKNLSNVFNLGCGHGYSVFEVIKEVEKACGKKVIYEVVPRRSGDPSVSYADASKAKEILSWTAKYSLEEMAKTAWKWHQSHPKGYGK